MTPDEARKLVGNRVLCRLEDWQERAKRPDESHLVVREGVQQTVIVDIAAGGKMVLLSARGGYHDEPLGWQKAAEMELVQDLGHAVRSPEDFVETWMKAVKQQRRKDAP